MRHLHELPAALVVESDGVHGPALDLELQEVLKIELSLTHDPSIVLVDVDGQRLVKLDVFDLTVHSVLLGVDSSPQAEGIGAFEGEDKLFGR